MTAASFSRRSPGVQPGRGSACAARGRSGRRRFDADRGLAEGGQNALTAGLYGYNGVLVGLVLATFLALGATLWIYVALGVSVSTVAMLGTASALKPFGSLAPTALFVAVTWIMLLATYGFAGLFGAVLLVAGVVAPSSRLHPSRSGSEPILRVRFSDLPGVPESERCRASLPCRSCRQLGPCGVVRARRRDARGRRGARLRRGKRSRDPGPARL